MSTQIPSDDSRYPRPQWVRFLRSFAVDWWIITIILFVLCIFFFFNHIISSTLYNFLRHRQHKRAERG